MDLADLNNLDIKNLGTAPLAVKVMVVLIVCGAIVGLGYYFDTQEQLTALEKVEVQEGQLRQTFEIKQKKAAHLDVYRQQLEDMRRTFGALLRQLPSKTEIPGLIVDISQTGLASGLEIELFKPGPELKKDFYAEKPIQLQMKGAYHQFGTFAGGIAALPRIVTLHDIVLTPGPESDTMTMSATAKTYRYLDDEE